MADKTKDTQKVETPSYTVGEAIKIADDIFKLSKEKKYNLGAFVHGIIFSLEYVQHSYRISQQQMALIKRDCRKYFKDIESVKQQKS